MVGVKLRGWWVILVFFLLMVGDGFCADIVLFDFETGTQGWKANPIRSSGTRGGEKGEASIDRVPGREDGNFAVRFQNRNWKAANIHILPLSLSEEKRVLNYRGISLWCKKEQGDFQKVKVTFHAKDTEGNDSYFAGEFYPKDNKWHRIEITNFWSRSGHRPDLSTISDLLIWAENDIVIDFDDIGLILEKEPSTLKEDHVLFAFPATASPRIDGVLDDKCWENASSFELTLDNGKKPIYPTKVKVCYDKNALYVSAHQSVPRGVNLRATVKSHDGSVWEDDCFEVFLDPHHTHAESFQLDINLLGTKFEYSTINRLWDGPWEAATKKRDGFWDVEISIPYKSLGVSPPEVGTSWGFNTKRIYYGESEKITEHTGWATLKHAGYRQFGDLIFCSASSSPYILKNMDVFVPDEGVFKFLFPVKGLSGNTHAKLSLSLPAENSNIVKEELFKAGDEKKIIEIVHPVKEEGQAKVNLCILDEEKKNVVAYTAVEFPVSVPIEEMDFKEIVLWPPPKEVDWSEGYFRINNSSFLYKTKDCPSFPVELFQEKIKKIYGLVLRQSQDKDRAKIEFSLKKTSNIPEEGYLLKVTPSGISIEASTEPGIYYGMRTLLSLIEQSSVRGEISRARYVQIRDWPDLPFRALYARIDWRYKASMSVESMCDFIYRSVAGNKYNALILNVRGALRYKSHPEIANSNAISPEDMKKIVDFARRHYIDVIPGGNSPGHADWIVGPHPELREDGDIYTLCTSHPDTYPLLFDLYDELCEIMGPSKYFHIGHDEVRWKTEEVPPEKRCRLCAGKEKSQILLEDIIKLRNHFKKKGRRIMMFNDMLIPEWNGGGRYQTARIRDKIPRDVIMMPWSYVGETIRPFVELGFTVIRSNTSYGQYSLDNFFKDYEIIKGDSLALFSTISWLTFIHDPREDTHNTYNFLMVAESGGCFWNKQVAKERLSQRVSRMGNHIARQFLETPKLHASGEFIPVDISRIAQMPLEEWFNLGKGRDLSNFPKGDKKIAGIPFLLSGKGYVPEKEPSPIPINEKINSFFVMHTIHIPNKEVESMLHNMVRSEMDDDKGLVIGWYRLKYNDGEEVNLPLRLGYNIYRWDGKLYGRYLYRSRWTWSGATPSALKKDPYARDIAIQQVEFINPHPEKDVSSIRLINKQIGVIPVLLGITVEKSK